MIKKGNIAVFYASGTYAMCKYIKYNNRIFVILPQYVRKIIKELKEINHFGGITIYDEEFNLLQCEVY